MAVDDYLEECHPGMKRFLLDIRKLKRPGTRKRCTEGFWSHNEELYRFLKLYTGEQMHKSIECTKDDDGHEAYRQLDVQCEPSV